LGLGHRERAAQLARGHPRQEALALLVGAVAHQHVGHDEVRVDDPRHAHPAAGELAHRERVRGQVEPEAAVLLRDREAEDAELAQAGDDLVRERVGVFVLGGDRDDLLVDEPAHQADDLALVLGQLVEDAAHAVTWATMPAASPRATTCSAILRDASSIIWPSCMTAPRRSTWVAWWYASRSRRAASNWSWVGMKTSFATSTWDGCSTHLPSNPTSRARWHRRRYSSTFLMSVYGPSIACRPYARAVVTIFEST